MPRPTARYRFEFRLAEWATALSRGLTGRRCALFVGFRPDGSVRRVYLQPPGVSLDGEAKAALAGAYSAWFLCTPYADADETYLEWLGLAEDRVAGWLGASIGPEDLAEVRGGAPLAAWPASWRAIVG